MDGDVMEWYISKCCDLSMVLKCTEMIWW
uniref:Uncharacterized protein n=1 Tax=Arundo donax TaxID=35708 RepID=A0A0A9GP64_ARUDO